MSAPQLHICLERTPHVATDARRVVERELQERQATPELTANAKLVVSELVTNAFKHGVGRIEMRLVFSDDRVRVEVIDEGTENVPRVREQPGNAIGGWGLRVVDRVARQWGVFEGTTHVWADLGARRD